jgi:hypothetical protein
MAFNFLMQLATASLVKNFPENATVVEWGNQRFRYNEKWIDRLIKVSGKKIRKPVNFVWEYFEDLGFSDYVAIDVNTELKAIAMDLNFILKEKYNYERQFDYVTNNGTGEHIFDQRTVFENMHNLCKKGGIMINILPFAPWFNHCFFSYHPGLFRDIVAANGYKWKFMWIGQNIGKAIEIPYQMDSWGYFEQKRPRNPVSKLEKVYDLLHQKDNNAQNVSIICAYQKTTNEPFVIPMQGRYVNDVNSELKKEYSDKNVDVRQSDHKSANY